MSFLNTDKRQFHDIGPENQLKIIKAKQEGKCQVYYTGDEEWSEASGITLNFDHIYRLKPKQKPSINWDHVAPEYKWLATDADGETYLYAEKPRTTARAFEPGISRYANVKGFASFKAGDCHWIDSLVERPAKEFKRRSAPCHDDIRPFFSSYVPPGGSPK